MRYTERDKYSDAVYAHTDDYSVRQKLADYEDTGYEPWEISMIMRDFKARLEAMEYLSLDGENASVIRDIIVQMLVSIKDVE